MGNEIAFEPLAPHPFEPVASTVPVATVWFVLTGLYTKTTAVSGCARSVSGIVAVSCLLLTNDVVTDVPFHTTTALLSKFLPSTVRVKPLPPTVALVGESEVTDGVDGQEEQETAESRKIANAAKRGDFFIVAIGVHFRLPAPLLHHYVESGSQAICPVRHDNGSRGACRCGAVVPACLRRRTAVCACNSGSG